MSRLAIINGKAAFLAPEIGIVPDSLRPPEIRMRSMSLPFALVCEPPDRNIPAVAGRQSVTPRRVTQSPSMTPEEAPIAAKVGQGRRHCNASPSSVFLADAEVLAGRSEEAARPRACTLRRLRFFRKAALSRALRRAGPWVCLRSVMVQDLSRT